MTTTETTEPDSRRIGAVQALRHPTTEEAGALSGAVLYALETGGVTVTQAAGSDEAQDPSLMFEFGDALDLLDEGGWYLSRYPEDVAAHPADQTTRQAALAMARDTNDLEAVDRIARYLHDGSLPDTPVEAELLAAVAAYDQALAQPDDDERSGALAAGRQLADTVSALLHA